MIIELVPKIKLLVIKNKDRYVKKWNDCLCVSRVQILLFSKIDNGFKNFLTKLGDKFKLRGRI